MKMDTMNISLTPQQSEYVRRTVDRDFGNASEFFRDMLRERMRREIEADLAVLGATTKGAPAGPGEREIKSVLALQRQVRRELKRAGRVTEDDPERQAVTLRKVKKAGDWFGVYMECPHSFELPPRRKQIYRRKHGLAG